MIAFLGIIITTLLSFIAYRVNKMVDWKDVASVDIAIVKTEISGIKKVTDAIPSQMDTIKEDVVKTHKEGINMFIEEIEPVKKKINEIELDVKKIKVHVNYKE